MDGTLSIPEIGNYYSSSIQLDDKLLISQDIWPNSVGVYRYTPDADADASFGSSGVAEITEMSSGNSHQALIQTQNDGKVLVAAHYFSGGYYTGYLIARLLAEDAVSVNDLKDNEDIHVFPNPASDQLIISCPLVHGKRITISVMNMTGKFLLKENLELNSDAISLDVSKFSSGIYLISVQSSANSFTTKFVKQ